MRLQQLGLGQTCYRHLRPHLAYRIGVCGRAWNPYHHEVNLIESAHCSLGSAIQYLSLLWPPIEHAMLGPRCWWQFQPGTRCHSRIFFGVNSGLVQRILFVTSKQKTSSSVLWYPSLSHWIPGLNSLKGRLHFFPFRQSAKLGREIRIGKTLIVSFQSF